MRILDQLTLRKFHKASQALDEVKYGAFYAELREICSFNGIENVPEVKICDHPGFVATLAADSRNNTIFISRPVAEEISQSSLVCHAAHELAHIVLKHRGAQPKRIEYLIDRMAAAFVRDEERYKSALTELNEWVEKVHQQEYANLEVFRETGYLTEDAYQKRLQTLKNSHEEIRKIYGTHTERLANIQYDINRRTKQKTGL